MFSDLISSSFSMFMDFLHLDIFVFCSISIILLAITMFIKYLVRG